MSQPYLDTSVRRVTVRFFSRTATTSAGRAKPTYTELVPVSMTNFKPRGHSEYMVDGVLQIVSTAQVTLQYRPDIKRGDRLQCLADQSVWEIMHIENVDMQCRDMVLTVRDVEGV